MIPIRDTITSSHKPVVNWALIGVNTILFFVEMHQGDALREFIYLYGLVPARYSDPSVSQLFTTGQQFFALLSFMFLHGGFFHLFGNMWFLYIFGDNVEDRIGHLRYIAFYLLCGWASGLTHLLTNLHSQTPTIGASGAIAGVMGAYVVLYPRSRIITLIPILFIPYFVELPAALFLGLWLLFQFMSAALAGGLQSGSIAWWAHIGGFIFGALLLKLALLIPDGQITQVLRKATTRRGSPRFQMAGPSTTDEDSPPYGTIFISPREAVYGTRKLVSIPGRFGNKLLRVSVPPGIHNGDLIRLRGVGDGSTDPSPEDVYLQIRIITDIKN